MGMHEARGKLAKLMRELNNKWHECRGQWDDDVARRFEIEVMQELEADLKSAVTAMDSAAAVISKVKRDCGD